MPRIAPLDPPYPADVQKSFDAIMQGAPPLMLFRTLAKSPRAWAKFRGGSAAPLWSPAERALLAAVEALHTRAALSNAEFADLRAHYDEDQVMELLLLCGFYRTVAYICRGLDLPLEANAARFADVA